MSYTKDIFMFETGRFIEKSESNYMHIYIYGKNEFLAVHAT